jgi:tagatose 1,6-diphosphate aldolase GatY/KbaY
MLASTAELLQIAQAAAYAIGAFNVYNFEGVRAVIGAAEAERSPVMLQVHPGALAQGGPLLIDLCLAAGRAAAIPVAVHLDHSTSLADIRAALDAGLASVMADGSHLVFDDNVAFVRAVAALAHERRALVEAELGRLSGSEDGLTVADYEARLTDPGQAADFVMQTGADALAVCIGNVHGHYQREPDLDFERLAAIRGAVSVPLVLHGASGLPDALVRRAIALGICKLNVNTELRAAYVQSVTERVRAPRAPDLADLMAAATAAMQAIVVNKLHLFGSAGKV